MSADWRTGVEPFASPRRVAANARGRSDFDGNERLGWLTDAFETDDFGERGRISRRRLLRLSEQAMRTRHDAVLDRRSLRLLGRSMPRTPRISRPSPLGTNPPGPALADRPADRVRESRRPNHGHLSRGALRAAAVSPKRSARSATTSSSPTRGGLLSKAIPSEMSHR